MYRYKKTDFSKNNQTNTYEPIIYIPDEHNNSTLKTIN
jgi:hypothetical protein